MSNLVKLTVEAEQDASKSTDRTSTKSIAQTHHRAAKWDSRMGRTVGIAFGIATQLLFLWTVVELFWFLRFGGRLKANSNPAELGGDLLLAVGFAVPHSVLLAPRVQQFLKSYIPSSLQACLHCSVTCLTLLIMFRFWTSDNSMLWQATGALHAFVLCGFYGSWAALLYSLSLTGLGYQTGLTQWWNWLRKKPVPRREFVVRGAYRWMRHPVYLSFLGLIWFTPTMSWDHAILTLVWTIYIYIGSYFKDRRLLRFIGTEYHDYATKVTGLPLIGFGPLTKLRS